MIALKEHNDIVQKLMKELTAREGELKVALKERGKPIQTPQLEPTPNEKQLAGRISQLNKEYKDKITSLTQQLRSKSTENKELKERLTTRSNMEAKEKDHIAELMRKNYDRKPSSAHDHKVAALISHYEAEITKKAKFIETLHKQLREAEQSQRIPPEEDQNCKDGVENEQTRGISLVQHQRELGRAKIEAAKQKRLFEEKDKEYRDLSRRYSELTNQYYKIVNAYGLEQDSRDQADSHSRTLPKTKSTEGMALSRQGLKGKLKTNALHNLLQEMADSDTEQDNSIRENSPRQITVKPTRMVSYEEEGQEAAQESLALGKLQEILSLLSLSDPSQLLPVLSRMKTQNGEFQLADTICRSLQAFLYTIGKGKLPRDQLISALEDLEQSYTRNLQAVGLLDQLCIAVGAKRERVNERVQELLRVRSEYYQQLKSLKYTQELSKANKVVEFIEFFQLDREQVELPQQLSLIQEQLKAINKYTKEVRAILEIDADKSPQMVLQLALRYMEKSTAFMAQYERKSKPKNA